MKCNSYKLQVAESFLIRVLDTPFGSLQDEKNEPKDIDDPETKEFKNNMDNVKAGNDQIRAAKI